MRDQVFISYSHQDEAWKDRLVRQLRVLELEGALTVWDDRSTEVPRLLQRRAKDGLRIIPLIVHPCAWQAVDWLAEIQCRPRDGRALSEGRKAKVEVRAPVRAHLFREVEVLFRHTFSGL